MLILNVTPTVVSHKSMWNPDTFNSLTPWPRFQNYSFRYSHTSLWVSKHTTGPMFSIYFMVRWLLKYIITNSSSFLWVLYGNILISQWKQDDLLEWISTHLGHPREINLNTFRRGRGALFFWPQLGSPRERSSLNSISKTKVP